MVHNSKELNRKEFHGNGFIVTNSNANCIRRNKILGFYFDFVEKFIEITNKKSTTIPDKSIQIYNLIQTSFGKSNSVKMNINGKLNPKQEYIVNYYIKLINTISQQPKITTPTYKIIFTSKNINLVCWNFSGIKGYDQIYTNSDINQLKFFNLTVPSVSNLNKH